MASTDGNYVELLRWSISIAVPAVSGLGGVALGAWLARKQERVQRRHDFVAKQLQDFYSPLLGLRSEIEMLSKLRVRIHEAADTVWRQLCDEARERGGPDELKDLNDARRSEFERIIEYDNRKLAEDLLPRYRQMVTIFRENFWLAETDTRTHFAELVEFVEIWDRYLDEAIPGEVIDILEHGEESLHPFYQNLQKKHDELRAKLARGKA